MTPQQLITSIYRRLNKAKIFVLIIGVAAGIAFSLYARQKPVNYTSKASIFPLTAGNDYTSGSSALGALVGGEPSRSFTDDASINIIELAQSRTTREEVASIRDSSMGNKTIAELLVDDINTHLGYFENKMEMPPNHEALITWAGGVLKEGLNASINKNNMLILSYTGRSPDLVRTISYGFINKISLFYIQLKQEKARRDFEFATSKVDSLNSVMNAKDNRLIALDKKTLFTNTSKLEYRVPTENLIADKQMIRQQYAQAVANQQNAAYKLQKATPVIKVLDKPEPPYDVQTKSATIFGVVGFFAALFLSSLLFISGIIVKYIRYEANKLLFGEKNEVAANAGAPAL